MKLCSFKNNFFLKSIKSCIDLFRSNNSGTPLFKASILMPKEVCSDVNLKS